MRIVLAGVLLLGGCATQSPTAVAPAARTLRPALPSTPIVEGAWSFSTGTGGCVARVGQAGLGLSIRAVAGTASFELQPAGGAGFVGPAGNWRLRREEMGGTQPMERALPRVRALLGGGVLTAVGRRPATLRVPDAGPSGRDWYGCLAGPGAG